MENKLIQRHNKMSFIIGVLSLLFVLSCASKPAEDNYEYVSVGGMQGYSVPKKKAQKAELNAVCETQDKNCQDKKISDQMNTCRTKRDAESCYATGRLMEEYFDKWVKGWRDTSRGDKTHKVLKWYNLGCDRGSNESCISLKNVLSSTCAKTSSEGDNCAEIGHYEAKHGDYAAAEKIFKASCTTKDKSGCGGLLCVGYIKIIKNNYKGARDIFNYACKAAPEADGLSDATAERGCSESRLNRAKSDIILEEQGCLNSWKNQWGSFEEE